MLTGCGALGLLVVALAGSLSSCGGAGHESGPRLRTLIVQAALLQRMLAHDEHLAATFAHRVTYVTAADAPPRPVPGLAGTVVPTRLYKSYETFADDAAAGRIPGSVRAVMYDPEKWAATPAAEQREPRAYMTRFSELARAHDLVPILAPARDLVLVRGGSCEKQDGENLNQAYIRCGLATAVRGAGALVIQSQANQFDVAAFRRFVAAVTGRARAVNPRIAVLAQLATAPLGQEASVPQLLVAARSVAGIADGLSINVRRSDIPSASELLRSFRRPGDGGPGGATAGRARRADRVGTWP
jgi:hypothetical protein